MIRLFIIIMVLVILQQAYASDSNEGNVTADSAERANKEMVQRLKEILDQDQSYLTRTSKNGLNGYMYLYNNKAELEKSTDPEIKELYTRIIAMKNDYAEKKDMIQRQKKISDPHEYYPTYTPKSRNMDFPEKGSSIRATNNFKDIDGNDINKDDEFIVDVIYDGLDLMKVKNNIGDDFRIKKINLVNIKWIGEKSETNPSSEVETYDYQEDPSIKNKRKRTEIEENANE